MVKVYFKDGVKYVVCNKEAKAPKGVNVVKPRGSKGKNGAYRAGKHSS